MDATLKIMPMKLYLGHHLRELQEREKEKELWVRESAQCGTCAAVTVMQVGMTVRAERVGGWVRGGGKTPFANDYRDMASDASKTRADLGEAA